MRGSLPRLSRNRRGVTRTPGGGPVICSGKPADNLEDFFLGMGEPATERRLPEPGAPDLDRLTELCARTGIELV